MRLKGWAILCASMGVVLFAPAKGAWTGEIILDAPAGNEQRAHGGAQGSASRAREESRRTDDMALPASAVEIMDGNADVFFPQHGDDSLPNAKARELRNNAKERQSNTIVLPPNKAKVLNEPSPEAAAQEGVANNVSKARAYMKNSTSQSIADLPVVSCDNAAGLIGDGAQSGNIIIILRDGKQVKARCR